MLSMSVLLEWISLFITIISSLLDYIIQAWLNVFFRFREAICCSVEAVESSQTRAVYIAHISYFVAWTIITLIVAEKEFGYRYKKDASLIFFVCAAIIVIIPEKRLSSSLFDTKNLFDLVLWCWDIIEFLNIPLKIMYRELRSLLT